MGNVKIVVKVIFSLIGLVILAEIFGACFNAITLSFRMNSAVSIISSNSGSSDSHKTFIEAYTPDREVYSQMVIVVKTKNIADIELNLADKFNDMQTEILPLNDIYKKDYPKNHVGYYPDYTKYKDNVDLRPDLDNEEYYIIGMWKKAVFSHNHISYYIDYLFDKDKEE